SKAAQKNYKDITVHIKVDTGMGRMGFINDPVDNICEIAELKGLKISGVMSHFSDSDSTDQSFAKLQIERFNLLRKQLVERGIKVKIFHMANSAAIVSLPESHFDAVRPGLILYGVSPFDNQSSAMSNILLTPAMSVKTRLVSIRKVPSGTPISYGRTFVTKRESLIGVISIGYADGFFRAFSNNAEVLIRGKRLPVIGRVCMDLTMIDLTDIKDGVEESDEVIIMGRQGTEFISASELAYRANTIPYEILTSLGRMAQKIYKE
ncbi:MAG: alanine racemase, partial [Thermodesulfovibrionales bacterium]|nr:alanine racemase [Thermodesulfovibrionales bacterium]